MADPNDPDPAELLRAIAAMAPTEGAGMGETLLRAIVANMPAVLAVIDPRGHVLWANRTNSVQSVGEVLGRSIFEFMPPDDQADAREARELVVRTGRPARYTGFGPGKLGPRSRYETWLAPISRDDRVIAIALITRDVSEEWEVYEALRDREQRLSLVLRAAGMGTWRFDPRTLTVELDEHARAIYGLTVARVDSRVFTAEHVHPEDRIEVDKRALESAAARRPYVAQNRIIRTDGQVRWVEITGSPIVDERGALACLMGTVTDITERRDLEARALQAQRLDAVGQLTAGIAHNFNNVLAAIMPALSIIERDVKPSSSSLVRGASQATARAADLVRQLMTFAGRNRTEERTVEAPGELVERTVRLCRSTFDRGIALHVEVAPELPAFRVDGGQIEQAVLNLLLNARDAVSHLGQTSPKVRVRVTREPSPDFPEPGSIAIVVEDNGPGVPESLRERIFDPFFTTKPIGTGTGLGLSTAYAIAREHGGSLRCGGEYGRGARFTLLIPAVDAAPTIVRVEPRQVTRVQGTVLVVDDEECVRETIVSVLAEEGFAVLSADSADQAMIVLATKPEVDVVLLDLNMPGSSWRTLVAAIRQDHPNARVVAFTGGITQRDGTLDGWLAKPASPEAIIEAITKAIARDAAE